MGRGVGEVVPLVFGRGSWGGWGEGVFPPPPPGPPPLGGLWGGEGTRGGGLGLPSLHFSFFLSVSETLRPLSFFPPPPTLTKS